jgi:thioredoxin-like negative regulator of GroEL
MMKQSDFVFSLTLNDGNRAQVLAELAQGRPVVACLCAAWCDTCSSYRAVFETLAQRHPDQRFIWIDIEDQSDIVGELDIDNFPTILIQRDALVAFFGPVLPDPGILQRLLQAQMAPSAAELASLVQASAERRAWQAICDLRTLLQA